MIMSKIGKISVNDSIYSIYDAIYPIGSIYMSMNSTSPSTLFGGSWERLKNCFLFGVDESRAEYQYAGNYGGEEKHKLWDAELPPHSHTISPKGGSVLFTATRRVILDTNGGGVAATTDWGNGLEIGICGSGEAHNNMPPYVCIYVEAYCLKL